MTTEKVTINDKAAFQTVIDKLTELNKGLDEKLNAAGTITAAVTAAASKEVVTGGDTTGTGTPGGKVAAAYTSTVGALGSTVDALTTQAKSSSTAVSTAISDLTSLLNGLTQIDNDGAENVKKS